MNRAAFDRVGLGLMLLTIFVWAGGWIAMKLVVPYIGPFDFIAVRYLIGAVVLFSILVATGRPLGMPPWKLTLLAAATQITGFQGFVQTALISGGVGKVSLMAYTTPFWVVLFAWALQGERPTTARHWGGIALAASGLVCFLEPWARLGDLAPVALGLCSGLLAGAWVRNCPSACSSAMLRIS